MKFNLIDIDNWNRKPYFEHYLNVVRCTYSMTGNIDITDLLREIKLMGLKLYPTIIYIITVVVNRHKEFRTCFDKNGKLGYWDSMSPSYTIFHKGDETFSSIWTEYDEKFSLFYNNYIEDIKSYGNVLKFMPKPDQPANTFNVSSIPWVNFTGFNLNIYNDATYLIPIFTIGKYFEQDNRIYIPLSVQVHHAVCDGFHTGRLFNEVQELASNFETWLGEK